MDRLAALFEQLSVPEVARLLRRTGLSALGVAIVAFVVSIVLNHVLAGLGIAIGLGLGLGNIRLVTRSVVRMIEENPERPKRVLAGRSLGRLGITTVIVIGLMVASNQVGLGAFAGLALFYVVLIANLLREILHSNTHRMPA